MMPATGQSNTPAGAATTLRAADQRTWAEEIYTPAQTYNANVPVDAIERDPGNRVPTAESIHALAETIQSEGLLQPITLRELGGGRYRIIAGETRWLAFKLLSRLTIPAMIRAVDAEAAEGPSEGDVALRLVENLTRTDLNAVDQARGFKQLCELGRTQKQVGALFGLSQPVVANSIRMLSLPADVLEFIRQGKLSGAHGVALARWAKWPKLATVIAEIAIENHASAKVLDQDCLPYNCQLTRLGYVVSINTRSTWNDRDPVYVVPPELLELDEFLDESHCVYYLREPGTPDLWAPEKKKQDAAREAKATAEKAKQDKALASGKKTKEQIEREKKLAANRALRAEIGSTYEAGIDALKVASTVTADMIAVLIEAALADGRNSNRIDDACDDLGINLGKRVKFAGDAEWKNHFGHYDLMTGEGASTVQAVKVAVAAILKRHHDDDLRFLSKMAPELRLIAQSAPPLTQQQRIERAAKKARVTPAKFVIAAGCWLKGFPALDVRLNSGLDLAKVKAVKALIDADDVLATVCSNAHAMASAIRNKDPQRAACEAKIAAKVESKVAAKAAKKGGAKK